MLTLVELQGALHLVVVVYQKHLAYVLPKRSVILVEMEIVDEHDEDVEVLPTFVDELLLARSEEKRVFTNQKVVEMLREIALEDNKVMQVYANLGNVLVHHYEMQHSNMLD